MQRRTVRSGRCLLAACMSLLVMLLSVCPAQARQHDKAPSTDTGLSTARQAARPRLLVGPWSRDFEVRPTRIVNTGDGSSFIGYRAGHGGAIRWAKWSSSRAVGIGTFWINDGEPCMATGTLYPHRARLVASRVRNGRYTRLVLRFRGGNPVWTPGEELHVYRYRLLRCPYGYRW